MRRSRAFIAIGAAVALGVGIVAIGVVWGSAGEGGGETPGTTSSGDPPAGSPRVVTADGDTPEPAAADDVQRNIARLEKRSAADPGDVGLLLDLGDAYFLGWRLRQAEHAFTQALHEDPDNATATVRRAMVWHARGDSERATESLAAVIAADPDQQEAQYSLAIIAFSEGRIDEAKAAWKAAARIDPGSSAGQRSQSFVDLLEDRGSATPESEE